MLYVALKFAALCLYRFLQLREHNAGLQAELNRNCNYQSIILMNQILYVNNEVLSGNYMHICNTSCKVGFPQVDAHAPLIAY